MENNTHLPSDSTKEIIAEYNHGSFKTYFIGFLFSIVLTLIAYFLVDQNLLSGKLLPTALIGLSLIQLVVQLRFFLHLGYETKTQWNLLAFIFMIIVLLILIPGTLWIMSNLDYRMMPAMQMPH